MKLLRPGDPAFVPGVERRLLVRIFAVAQRDRPLGVDVQHGRQSAWSILEPVAFELDARQPRRDRPIVTRGQSKGLLRHFERSGSIRGVVQNTNCEEGRDSRETDSNVCSNAGEA